ncbi:MAG: VOC family protein [Bacteroidetes bacterium]|nr:VOC family protein [Bacteroidota bacterium]
MNILHVHHVAIIASDYLRSKQFYCDVLGMKIVGEHYRAERQSYKCDLSLNGNYTIELFSFPNSPARLSHPEATGLRHLAFAVQNLDDCILELSQKGIHAAEIRLDEFTGKRFCFISDPDQLPIEFYEK